MLASRGFVYRSEASAGAFDYYHPNCDCRIVQGCSGDTLEGYDPDALYNRWKIYELLNDDKSLTNDVRLNAKRYLSKMSATDESMRIAVERAWADAYEETILKAWSKFKVKKTPENYEATVGAALAEIGRRTGIELIGEYMAQPNGDEIWAVLKTAKKKAKMLYASNKKGNPDASIDDVLIEIKTPSSMQKITDRLAEAVKKFRRFPNNPKVCILSLLRLKGLEKEAIEIAERFVKDKTFDRIICISPLNDMIELTK